MPPKLAINKSSMAASARGVYREARQQQSHRGPRLGSVALIVGPRFRRRSLCFGQPFEFSPKVYCYNVPHCRPRDRLYGLRLGDRVVPQHRPTYIDGVRATLVIKASPNEVVFTQLSDVGESREPDVQVLIGAGANWRFFWDQTGLASQVQTERF